MDLAKQLFNLLQLSLARPENFRTASEVVDDRNRKNLKSHLLFNFSACLLVSVGFKELVYRIVILIRVFPPLRTELANITNIVFLLAFGQRAKLQINLNKILQVELDIFA
jgi:hypothetical protein